MRNKCIGYNINVMRQSACLIINPITVDSFASLFNCMPVGRASDSMMDQTLSSLICLSWLGLDLCSSDAWSFGVQLEVVFFSISSVVLFYTLGFFRCHNTFLSSLHPWLLIGIIHELFVPYVNSLMGKETSMRTTCFEPLLKLRTRVWIQ